MDHQQEFMTTPELCEWLRVAKSTISRWRNEGLPHYGKTRAFRYKKEEVLKWLEEQKESK